MDTVTITKEEYDQLKADSKWLGHLENAGVDNWDGYGYAHQLRKEDERTENDCE